METIITSLQNARIKNLVALQQKSSARKAAGVFVVEGRRELMHCIEHGYVVRTVFYNPNMLDLENDGTLRMAPDTEVIGVSDKVYEKIAYRGSTEGVIAEVEPKNVTLDNLPLGESPLVVVLESVEKPGNLGAILRSADASGVDAVIVCDPLTDIYNPNLIRSSIGSAFTVQCVTCTSAECIEFLKARGIQILTAQLQDSEPYYATNMSRPTAIVMGTEATGLTEQWRKAADAHIRIPMLGSMDSLNVSVSAAILMFEAVRQRLTT